MPRSSSARQYPRISSARFQCHWRPWPALSHRELHRNNGDPGVLTSLPLPEDVIQKELSRNTQRLTKLKEILDEIGSNYERTATVVTENRKALEVIAAEAYRNIQSIGEQNLSDGQILLTAEQIREIWNTDRGCQ